MDEYTRLYTTPAPEFEIEHTHVCSTLYSGFLSSCLLIQLTNFVVLLFLVSVLWLWVRLPLLRQQVHSISSIELTSSLYSLGKEAFYFMLLPLLWPSRPKKRRLIFILLMRSCNCGLRTISFFFVVWFENTTITSDNNKNKWKTISVSYLWSDACPSFSSWHSSPRQNQHWPFSSCLQHSQKSM